jgi:gas vesicle protein
MVAPKEVFSMSAKNYWLAFGIGVAAGAAIALLYAPQSGERTRKKLRKGVESAVDDASEHLKDAGDYLKAQAERFSDEAQDAIKRARGQASRFVDKAGDRASDVVDSVSDAVSDAVKSAKALV